MRKTFLITLTIFALTLISCEKFALEESVDTGETSESNGNVTLQITEAEISHFKRITYSIFRNGGKVKNINQQSPSSTFGTATFALTEGDYQAVVIGHNGEGNATISSPEKITFYKNKTTDTFCYYESFHVTEDNLRKDITPHRVTGMFVLHIKDAIPSTAKTIKFYYTGGSSTLNATTGYGCVKSRQTEEREMNPQQKDYRIYTLPHSDAKKLHIIITVNDQQGNTITKKDLKDVEIKQNNQTICSLNLFDGEEDGSTADFHFDPTWEGYIEAEYNPQNEMLAFCKTKCSIRKTKRIFSIIPS